MGGGWSGSSSADFEPVRAEAHIAWNSDPQNRYVVDGCGQARNSRGFVGEGAEVPTDLGIGALGIKLGSNPG